MIINYAYLSSFISIVCVCANRPTDQQTNTQNSAVDSITSAFIGGNKPDVIKIDNGVAPNI